MGRSPCCSKVGLRRGPWSTKEDALLTDYIQLHGEGQWRDLPKNAGLLRCGKSCRLRWMNYLRPGIKRGNISEDEEDLIVRLHSLLGNRWSLIAGRLPGRTDNEIKNHWNTHLLKKLNTAGIIHPNREFSKSKPNNNNNNNNNKKKKNKKKKKSSTITITTKEEEEEEEEELEHVVEPAKTKVYLPKPMRVSSDFSRTSSYESLISIGTYNSTTSNMSGGGGEGDDHYYNNNNNNNKVLLWEPLFEAAEDEFEMLSGGYNIILPAPAAADSLDAGDDVGMLDRVYDEYLQLL